jgi:hypothetical protein
MKNWRGDLAASQAWLDNVDVAKPYDVPLDRGVPTITVLESDGKLLFSQKRGEFEAARSMGTFSTSGSDPRIERLQTLTT